MATATLAELRTMIQDLPPQDKLALIDEITQQLRPCLVAANPPPYRSWRGILAHGGLAPSLEEIKELRREMWANFPRDIDVVVGTEDSPSASTVTKSQ